MPKAYWFDRNSKGKKGVLRGPFEVYSYNGIYGEVILMMGEMPTLVPFHEVKLEAPFKYLIYRMGGVH